MLVELLVILDVIYAEALLDLLDEQLILIKVFIMRVTFGVRVILRFLRALSVLGEDPLALLVESHQVVS